jgi:outer membrane protein TolC
MSQAEDGRFLPARSLSGFVTLTIPLFDWAVWGRVPAEQANVTAAHAQSDAVRAQVRGEAAETALRLRGARVLAEQAQTARELAAATLAVVEGRYKSGLATPIELFDAGTKDAEARRQAIRAELALALATVDVLTTTGRIAELAK